MFSSGQPGDDNLMLKLSHVSTVIMHLLQWAMRKLSSRFCQSWGMYCASLVRLCPSVVSDGSTAASVLGNYYMKQGFRWSFEEQSLSMYLNLNGTASLIDKMCTHIWHLWKLWYAACVTVGWASLPFCWRTVQAMLKFSLAVKNKICLS